MKEFVLTDHEASIFDDLGVSKPQWVLEQLRSHGFDLTRPVIYRYDSYLQQTRMVQYASTLDQAASQCDFDMDLSSDEDWARALDLLAPEPVPLCEELAHGPCDDSAPAADQRPAA